MNTFRYFFFEKTILGLIEVIEIDGIGELSAKLDTGNGAYNVLHGEDMEFNGEEVEFTTVEGIRMRKPIEDHIVINVGAGNKEERPIVLFDVKIGGRIFNRVPFSIGNRRDNSHKVLIGKGFIQKELDALIDVGSENIADEQIEVAV